jgi:hypothetical protein
MNPFVNYGKRSIDLPQGCKDLVDVLRSARPFPVKGGKLRCEYCGTHPVRGSGAYQCYPTENLKRYWCTECLHDVIEFASRPENAIPRDADLSNEQTRQKIETIRTKLDEFMRDRVRQREKDKGPPND